VQVDAPFSAPFNGNIRIARRILVLTNLSETPGQSMPPIQVIVFDLDNTLYDWVGFYIPSFLAMVRELSILTGISEAELKASFKKVHERHRSSEYAFGIEELDVLRTDAAVLNTREVFERFGPAIEAFRTTRDRTLHLYDGVAETLNDLKALNKKLVAVTDTTMYYATRRLQDLKIEQSFDMICAPADHGLPPGVSPEEARRFSDRTRYQSNIPIQLELDRAVRKPDPGILKGILWTTKTAPQEVLLVGDSLSKDILLAKRCGVWDVFAEYGTRVDPALYDELLKITYWTDQDVVEEEKMRRDRIQPTFTIQSFRELTRIIKKVESLPADETRTTEPGAH
jgi:FMN phosphatase YigB (HAD superfamily)